MMAKKGRPSMSLPRFRFTIGQAGLLIALCAVLFALLRTPAGAYLVVMVWAVVEYLILLAAFDRRNSGSQGQGRG
jgi:hypothetical protein